MRKFNKIMIRLLSLLIPVRKYRKRFRQILSERMIPSDVIKEFKNTKKYVKKYLHIIDVSGPIFQPAEVVKLPIWQIWLQGADKAPELVTKCLDSVDKYRADRTIHILDENNYGDYVNLPSHCIEKYKQGIIPKAHFTDILRIFLLMRYGGTWIDATVLLTDTIPDIIIDQPYFAHSKPHKSPQSALLLAGNWFIHAQPEHVLVKNTARLLSEYWLNESVLHNYFIFHILQRSMIDHSRTLRKIWSDVPYISCVEPHLLQDNMMLPFDHEAFQKIINITSIHKLTHKFDAVPEDSLLEHILRFKL